MGVVVNLVMGRNGSKWVEMGPNYQKWVQIIRNGSGMDQKWVQIFRNGSGFSEMGPDFKKWFRNGPEMGPITRNGSGFPEMGHECTRNGSGFSDCGTGNWFRVSPPIRVIIASNYRTSTSNLVMHLILTKTKVCKFNSKRSLQKLLC